MKIIYTVAIICSISFLILLLLESPRDASNKDSPASQADSGVFSIASSNSPSKDRDGGSGSSGTASTSPDSPNRIDRMPSSFGEPSFGSSGSSVGGINPASRDGGSNCKYFVEIVYLVFFL